MNSEPKSISRETTFERNLHARHDRSMLSEIFTGLCASLANDLQRRGYVAQTISIKVRYEDFRTITRDVTLSFPAADAVAIRRAAEECLRRTPLKRRLRLLGVRASSLSSGSTLHSMGMGQQAELPLTVLEA
jgi:DNA polymerase-4